MIPDIEIINSQMLKASAGMAVATVCRAYGIARSVFYYRKDRYSQYGILQSRSKKPKKTRTIGESTIDRIKEINKKNPAWKASRVTRELLKQGIRLSEKTARKYLPRKNETKPRKKYPKREYGKLEQLQLDVKGHFYIGKQRIYPIGVIDRGSRMAETVLRESFRADNIKELCNKFIDLRGKPKAIKTDNHRVFRGKKFNEWCDENGIKHKYIRKKSPWQNGYIESFFKTVEMEFLRENYFTSISEADKALREFMLDYNNARYHSVIGCTPIEKFNSMEDDNMDNLSKMSVP